MKLTNETFAPLRVFTDELVRCGVRHAVIAPGSRNAPLAYVLSDREELQTWSVLDERSAGFFALGIAKSADRPVIVTCSSGTAAVNLHPAVVEADHAGVPLIVLTADRPPELRDVGAGQAIDQLKLFGSSVRWFVEAGNHPLAEETLRHFRTLGCRAVAEAAGANPGPVHVNFPLREPLQPVVHELAELEAGEAARGRPEGRPWTRVERSVAPASDVLERLATAERPLIIAGEQHRPGLADALADVAAATHTPVLADALSQLRRHSIAQRAAIVAAYDPILRNAAARKRMEPDFVLRVGELPTSRPLREWLARLECPQVVVDPRGVWHEATRVATEVLQCDPVALLEHGVSIATPETTRDWTTSWSLLETAAQSAIDAALTAEAFPFEPAVYRSLLAGLDGGATVYVSSSMPVRDVECFAGICRDDVRFLANRGANGIDGVVSSALGAKAPWGCDHVILLTGDLALLHDIGALAIAVRHEIPITIVCVDNDGGGIFSFLPIAEHSSHFEDKIAAPSGLDLPAIVGAFGLDCHSPADSGQLNDAVRRAGLVHLRTERSENRAAHDRVFAAVCDSVSAALAGTIVLH